MTYFIVVATRHCTSMITKGETDLKSLRELWLFGLAPVYYVFSFAADWIGNTVETRDLHYFRNMLFHVVYFPAVLGVLFSLEQSKLLDPRTPNDMDGGKDIFVELRYKMLLVATAFEVLSIYTGHGGFIIGFGQTFVGVFAFGVFACYGLKLQDDDFTALMTDFAKDTCLYYVVGRVVAGLVWADAKLWYRLTRASPAFVALMTGVTNQDQMQVRAAIEAMSDMSSMSPTDHISNNINVKDRQGRTIVHHAAVRPDNQILRTILDFPGVNVNICDKYGQTPLYCAVRFGELTKEERNANLRALMAAGANSIVGDDEEDDLSLVVEVPEPAKPTTKKAKAKSAATARKGSKKGKAKAGMFSESEGEEGDAPASPKPKRSLRKRGK